MIAKWLSALKRAWQRFGFGACVAILCLIVCAAAVGFRAARLSAVKSPSAAILPSSEATPDTSGAPALSAPAGEVLRGYAPYTPVWSDTLGLYEAHEGVDFAPGARGLVYACMAGEVMHVGYAGVYGLCVTLAHAGGYESRYASLSSARVGAGDKVRAGQALGEAGESAVCESALGAHLHFEWRLNGVPADAGF